MIDASMPKKMRVHGNTSQFSDRCGLRKSNNDVVGSGGSGPGEGGIGDTSPYTDQK